MGTQQILMIILSVIVVGTAIAVGIQMFDTQLENQTRQALAAELMQQASMAQAWYRTPKMMGGGGNGLDENGDPYDLQHYDCITVAQYINRQATAVGEGAQYRNLHGTFQMLKQGDHELAIIATSDVNDIQVGCVFSLAEGSSSIMIQQM